MLTDLFVKYLSDVTSIRSKSIDDNNVQFHRDYELRLKAPPDWCSEGSIIDAIKNKKASFRDVVVIYSDTLCYRKFYNLTSNNEEIFYASYYELHSAIINASQDIRQQKRIKDKIEDASIVVILEGSHCPDIVLNAIRQFTNGSLIILD